MILSNTLNLSPIKSVNSCNSLSVITSGILFIKLYESCETLGN